MLTPILLKPKLLEIKNRWVHRRELSTHWIRNAVILGLTLGLMIGTYRAGYWVLEQVRQELDFAYLHSATLLGLILVFLLGMLLLTNCATALGSLYMGTDLGLIISSPLRMSRFFFEKFLEVIVTSSWMTAVFILPVVIMFGSFYQAPASYYLFLFLAMVPFFLIPAAGAIVLSTLLALLFPANKKRELFFLMALLALAGIYLMGTMLGREARQASPIEVADVFRVVSFVSTSNKTWSPSYWVAVILGEALEPGNKPVGLYLLLLYSTTVALIAFAYLVVRLFHFSAYSRASLTTQSRKIDSRLSQRIAAQYFCFIAAPVRAMVGKELQTAARDITQLVHAFLLFGLCALYLYTLSFQTLFQRILPEVDEKWWRYFLLSTNIAIEAFVITAMGTRFVFPSVSREGKSFWALKTSPLSIKEILRYKYFTWLLVVVGATSCIFGLAAFLLYSSFNMVLLKLVSNFFICVGLVGLGIGFGAFFANFSWQHPSQLTAGFGTLVYMLIAVLLIAGNLLLTGVAMYLNYLMRDGSLIQHPRHGVLLALVVLVIVGLNCFAARISLAVGARHLEKD